MIQFTITINVEKTGAPIASIKSACPIVSDNRAELEIANIVNQKIGELMESMKEHMLPETMSMSLEAPREMFEDAEKGILAHMNRLANGGRS